MNEEQEYWKRYYDRRNRANVAESISMGTMFGVLLMAFVFSFLDPLDDIKIPPCGGEVRLKEYVGVVNALDRCEETQEKWFEVSNDCTGRLKMYENAHKYFFEDVEKGIANAKKFCETCQAQMERELAQCYDNRREACSCLEWVE